MTAFASAQCQHEDVLLTWEIRSVNHRYLDSSVRLPESMRSIDPAARGLIKKMVERGKVEAQLNLQVDQSSATHIQLNEGLLGQLVQACRQVDGISNDKSSLNAINLLRWPGVIVEDDVDSEQLSQAALDCLKTTLEKLGDARGIEGESLFQILDDKLNALSEQVEKLAGHAPKLIAGIREKLLDRVATLSVEVDQQRLEHEVVFLAQKLDVDEEIDRLKAHVIEVGRVIRQNGAIGRRLDFLMQELNREANTLTSKSTDKAATAIAVEMKVLIEQMREQVQNVE